MSTPTAQPKHTIIRYQVSPPGFWHGWKPITVLRFRFFENSSHDEVTGDGEGARWVNDWSCESLERTSMSNDDSYVWRINGRNDWRTFDAALAALSGNTFDTFAEAVAASLSMVNNTIKQRERQLDELKWNVREIRNARDPSLGLT